MKNQRIAYLKLHRIAVPVYAFILLGAAMFISSETVAQKANFSGTWSFNQDKSVLGDGGSRGAAVKLVIKQEGNNMSMDRTTRRQSGEESTNAEKYTLDGKECENASYNRPKKSKATWSEDGKSLTIASTMTFERDGQETEINTVEIFKLSADGKSLNVDYTSKSPRGERKNTFVYDKQ
jgi:hypothetical protein